MLSHVVAKRVPFSRGFPMSATTYVTDAVTLGTGLLLARGLFGPVGPALLLSVMIVAAVSVHWKGGLFATTNGIEVPLLYATGAVALAFTGYGPFSLDVVLGIDQTWTPALKVAALAVGAVS